MEVNIGTEQSKSKKVQLTERSQRGMNIKLRRGLRKKIVKGEGMTKKKIHPGGMRKEGKY